MAIADLLEALSTAPDTQIDKAITPRLLEMSQDPERKADTLHEILDECACFSLASDFAMHSMHFVWSEMLKDEGRTVADALAARRAARAGVAP